MNTALIICQVLVYKVSQWCKLIYGTPPCLPTDLTGNIVRDAVETQGHLSWDNFMKERIAFEWCRAQAQYYNNMPNHSGLDSTALSTKLIKAIWSIFVDIWNAHNAYLHTELVKFLNNVLNKQVWKAFALKHLIFTSDRLLFGIDLYTRLQSSPESKRLWLES
eukprot:2074102-Ditylum_brightwellii.AAC.1